VKQEKKMNPQTAITHNPHDYHPVINLVLDGLTSQHSKRAYKKSLIDFLAWHETEGNPGLNKAVVQRYKSRLIEANISHAVINQRMAAIRKLAQEALDNGLINQTIGSGIANVKGVKAQGVRAGNWLTKEQAQELINAPDSTTLKGLRDRAILAVMLGAGLRRSEVAALSFEQIQQREARWVILDLVGKGGRVRTVPIPCWTKAAIDHWSEAAGIHSGLVFRRIRKGGSLAGDSMTSQAIYNALQEYAAPLGIKIAPHDCRRTFARLAYKGKAPIEQIQHSLGHASIKTTEIYLGAIQNLTDAPCDHLGIRLD